MSLTLLLRTGDLNETRRFHVSVPGFDATDTTENALTVEKHGGKLVFTEIFGKHDGFSRTLYFRVPDADRCFTLIHDDVHVLWSIQDMPCGSREFGIKECNGYHQAFQSQA